MTEEDGIVTVLGVKLREIVGGTSADAEMGSSVLVPVVSVVET